MPTHSSVAAELAGLTAALDDPAVDLAVLVDQLESAIRRAVSSYVGLSITLTLDGADPVEITTRSSDSDAPATGLGPIAASMRTPLPSADPDRTTPAMLTLYATTPGAFVDLAADIIWLTGFAASDVVVDAHLNTPSNSPTGAVTGLSTINQAIGVLIAGGSLPAAAVAELDAWAARHGSDRLAAARAVLAGLSGER